MYDFTASTNSSTVVFSFAKSDPLYFSPEMRQKFDSGEDPLDPENQQGGGGREQAWPFHFDPFQSGGSFHFKFHHN